MRSAEVREIARRLASLGHIKIRKGAALNVRRREKVRRALAEAGESLGWAEVAALNPDPVSAVTEDVKKMVRSGLRMLKRGVADELAEKRGEGPQLEAVVETVQELAADPETEYPAEITYSRTVKNPTEGLVTRTETVSVSDAKEAEKVAAKLERSLPRWEKLRNEMVAELHQRQKTLGELSSNLSDIVRSWSHLLRDVLATMH